MEKVVIFPSETATVVSLVKYPAIVRSRPTVVDKNTEKFEKMSPPLCEITAPLLRKRGKKDRKNVCAIVLVHGHDWLVL